MPERSASALNHRSEPILQCCSGVSPPQCALIFARIESLNELAAILNLMEYVRVTLKAHVPRDLWESFDVDCRNRGETAARALMEELWGALDGAAERVNRANLAECIWLESSIEEPVEETGEYERFWETGERASE